MQRGTMMMFVTSDIQTDQRVHRTATTLQSMGFDVVVTGRQSSGIIDSHQATYRIKRIGTIAKRGMSFFIIFNLKIFARLLFGRYTAIYANDLDTLVGCWAGAIIRRKPLIYDSHELFTEIPELVGRTAKKRIWKIAEKMCIKRAAAVIAVSRGVADELHRMYGANVRVIRNLPAYSKPATTRSATPTIIYQGYLNIGRGLELIIDTLTYLPEFSLIIAGDGDIADELKKRVEDLNLGGRISFTGRISPNALQTITPTAWLGVSLEEDMGLNYRYALPNKLFSYIMAQVPVLVSNLPEMRSIVDEHKVGIVAESRVAEQLAQQIKLFISNIKLQNEIADNLEKAAQALCWENERAKLEEVVAEVCG